MTARRWDILGVGDADVDLFIRVDHLPGHDEKVLGQYLGEYPGGIVANFCCAASHFGARTAMSSVVGDDRYGEVALAGLREFGVSTDLVRVRAGGRTYFCLVLLDSSGEKALTVVETDCLFPRREDIDAESFALARLVHLTPSDPELATWIASEAKRRGALVSVDVEPTMVGEGIATLAELLSCVDLVFPNGAGLARLFPGSVAEGAQALRRMGPEIVVVTQGSRGCTIVDREGVREIPAYRVPVVDTTGAGDCFNGAFLARYLQGEDTFSCARFASVAAALSVTRVGSRTALPSIEEAETRLAGTLELA